MPTSPLTDLENEHALLYLAVTNFLGYRALGVDLDDFTWPLCRRGVAAAEAIYEDRGQLAPSEHALATVSLCRDRGLGHDEHTRLFDLVMDPPLGVVADAAKLRRQRRMREQRDAHLLAIRALERGEEELATSTMEEARERAARRLRDDVAMRSARGLSALWREEVQRLQSDEGISPGLPKLKNAIGNLSPGMVIVVGGATGVGKSSLSLEMVLRAPRDGTKAGLISVEDTLFTTTTRIVSGLSGVSARALHMGQEMERAERALQELEELEGGFYMAECIGGTEQDVCANMTRMAMEGVKLVVVDYIGEVEASVRQQDRRNEIRWLMKRLKTHALRLGVALVIVSQLARPKERHAETAEGGAPRPKPKPSKHDLKEAGDLENSAEFIVLLWRDEDHDFAPVHVELAKSKIGGTGTRWDMQREVYAMDQWGRRVPGSSRLREVVPSHRYPEDYSYPLLVTDYVAQLQQLANLVRE